MKVSELVAYVGFGLSATLAFCIGVERDEILSSLAPRAVAASRVGQGSGDPGESLDAELAALGYAAHARVESADLGKSGVTLNEKGLVRPGLSVVFPEFGCERIDFIDVEGNVVRSLDVSDLPKEECYSLKAIGDGYVLLARPNLYRLDRSGRVVWRLSQGFAFHHDFDGSSDRIVALDGRTRTVVVDGTLREVVDQRLVTIGADGQIWSILSLHDVFWERLRRRAEELDVDPFSPEAVERLGMDGPGDFYHANSVQLLGEDSKVGRAGDVLVSLRTLDAIVVLDPESGAVRWEWGPGVVDHPHHPTLLPNGRLLVFDNGWHRGHSRVIEVEPETGRIVWEYKAIAPETFFTQRRGAAYRLSNGNTLITESDRGRAFEVTAKGRKVWEYWMPPSRYEDEQLRSTLFRVQRIEDEG